MSRSEQHGLNAGDVPSADSDDGPRSANITRTRTSDGTSTIAVARRLTLSASQAPRWFEPGQTYVPRRPPTVRSRGRSQAHTLELLDTAQPSAGPAHDDPQPFSFAMSTPPLGPVCQCSRSSRSTDLVGERASQEALGSAVRGTRCSRPPRAIRTRGDNEPAQGAHRRRRAQPRGPPAASASLSARAPARRNAIRLLASTKGPVGGRNPARRGAGCNLEGIRTDPREGGRSPEGGGEPSSQQPHRRAGGQPSDTPGAPGPAPSALQLFDGAASSARVSGRYDQERRTRRRHQCPGATLDRQPVKLEDLFLPTPAVVPGFKPPASMHGRLADIERVPEAQLGDTGTRPGRARARPSGHEQARSRRGDPGFGGRSQAGAVSFHKAVMASGAGLGVRDVDESASGGRRHQRGRRIVEKVHRRQQSTTRPPGCSVRTIWIERGDDLPVRLGGYRRGAGGRRHHRDPRAADCAPAPG